MVLASIRALIPIILFMPPPPTGGGGIMFFRRPSVRPLTPILRDPISLYLAKGFQWSLPQIFIM